MKWLYCLVATLIITFGSCEITLAEQLDNLTFPANLDDKISLFCDRLNQENNYGFGVDDNTLTYKSRVNHKWFINENNVNAVPDMKLQSGRLGIGTNDVNHELVVQGNDPVLQIRDGQQDNSGNAARIELLERAGGSFNGGGYMWWNGGTNRLLFGTKRNGDNTNVLVIDRNSNGVGIGTQNPGSFRLAVNGKIRAKEIVVEAGWSDYVFDKDYDLKPLREVKAFIDKNGHLPDVPSVRSVETEGLSLGESQAILLRKIEEQTLHLIAMDEQLRDLKTENVELRIQMDRKNSFNAS